MKNISVVLGALLALVGIGAAAQTPTDAQIAAIIVTANQVDIEAGRTAEKNGHAREVKAFGKQMVTDHTGAKKQAMALVKKLKIVPEENPTSESLQSGGVENLKTLKELKAADFDKAYIDQEVAYHEQVIEALEKTLIPSAQNAELKALLIAVRPGFLGHLEHAKRIQSALAK